MTHQPHARHGHREILIRIGSAAVTGLLAGLARAGATWLLGHLGG